MLRISLGCTLFAIALASAARAQDDHADTCGGEATELIMDAPATGGFIDPDTDEDWFRFTVEAGHQYELPFDYSANFYPYLRLFDEDCTTLIAEADRWDPPITFVAPSSGTRYLQITSEGQDTVGYYEVAVADQGEVSDDHGNGPGSATSIPTDGTVVGGEINYDYDADYFRFTAAEQSVYSIELRALPQISYVVGTLLDRDGVTYIDNVWAFEWPGDWARMLHYVLPGEGGDYYVRVDRAANPGTGPYEIRVALIECPGDLDGDGDTDQADLGILLADWGCSGGACAGDLDGDGDTDQADLGIFLADWGCGA